MKQQNRDSINKFKQLMGFLSSSSEFSDEPVPSLMSSSSSESFPKQIIQVSSDSEEMYVHPVRQVLRNARLYRTSCGSSTPSQKPNKKSYLITEDQVKELTCCSSKCISLIPISKIVRTRRDMQRLTEKERSEKIMSHMTTSYDEEFGTFEYFVGKRSICRSAFQTMYKISNSKYTHIKNEIILDKFSIHGNTNMQRSSIKKVTFDNWIKVMKENYTDVSPSGDCNFYFPICILKKDFYELYKTDIHDSSLCYGSRQFMSLLKKTKLKFPKNSKLGKCNTCIEIAKQLEQKNLDKSVRSKIISLKDEHIDEVASRKGLYYSHIRRAKNHPEQYASIIMDMTQDIKLPHFIPIPKDLTMGATYHFDFFLGCILNNGKSAPCFYCFPKVYETYDKNFFISLLFHYLKEEYSEYEAFPTTLYIQLDNCFKENKNETLFKFIAFLLSLGFTEKIILTYLPPGHTHENIDQLFSAVRKYLMRHEVLTYKALLEILSEVYGTYDEFYIISDYESFVNYDWSSFFEFEAGVMEGHSKSYQFQFELDEEEGFVTVMSRVNPIRGEWSKPMRLFHTPLPENYPQVIQPVSTLYEGKFNLIKNIKKTTLEGDKVTRLSENDLNSYQELLHSLENFELADLQIPNEEIFEWIDKTIYQPLSRTQQSRFKFRSRVIYEKWNIQPGTIVIVKPDPTANHNEKVWYGQVYKRTNQYVKLYWFNLYDEILIDGHRIRMYSKRTVISSILINTVIGVVTLELQIDEEGFFLIPRSKYRRGKRLLASP